MLSVFIYYFGIYFYTFYTLLYYVYCSMVHIITYHRLSSIYVSFVSDKGEQSITVLDILSGESGPQTY